MITTRTWTLLGALLLGCLVLFFLNLSMGSVWIPWNQLLKGLAGGPMDQEVWKRILWDLRLPKSLTALVAGGALAVSGLQMQTLFRNPLAGPYVLGVSSGASLGVALVVLGTGGGLAHTLGWGGSVAQTLAAFAGAFAVMLLVLAVARWVEDNATLLIIGLMFGYLTGSLVSIFIYFGLVENIQSYLIWTFGSFGGVTWREWVVLSALCCVGFILSGFCAKPLNALLLGPAYASSLGATVPRTRVLIIFSTAALAGSVTAFCGPIGFLGIAVPHLCRGLFRLNDHRVLLPACLLVGGGLALAADMVSQLPGMDKTLPLNSVTACVGAPVIVWLLLRQRKTSASLV